MASETAVQDYVEAQMLVRKPSGKVFEAFVDPEVTKHFWFSGSTGKLVRNAKVTWTWEAYGHSTPVEVTEFVENRKIVVKWDDPATTVTFHFLPMHDGASTYVVVRQTDLGIVDASTRVQTLNNAAGGFTTVLDGLKVYLEKGIEANLMNDKFPPDAPTI